MRNSFVDIDMGVGRQYGYDDIRRRRDVIVRHIDPADAVPQGEMKAIRLAANALEDEVADYLGVAVSTVSKWESGDLDAPIDVRARWLVVCAEVRESPRRRRGPYPYRHRTRRQS